MKKLAHLFLATFLLCQVALADGAEQRAGSPSLPQFGAYELEIYQIVGNLNLYVPPQVGDTTDMKALKMEDLETFLTFKLQSPYPRFKEIPLVHDISDPVLEVYRERKTPSLSPTSEINEYMVRADALSGLSTVEIHVREVVRNRKKDYYVHVIQREKGMFASLLVLGAKGARETYIESIRSRYEDPRPDREQPAE